MSVTPGKLQASGNSLPMSALFYEDETLTQLDLGSNVGASLRGLDHSKITAVEAYQEAAKVLLQDGYESVFITDILSFVQGLEGISTYGRVTGFDIIEHLDRADGEALLDAVEKIITDEFIWFVPVETKELLATDTYKTFMSNIYKNIPPGQVGLQTHRSLWTTADFSKRNYKIIYMKDYHMSGFDAFFAVKYTKPESLEKMVSRVKAYGKEMSLVLPSSSRIGANADVRHPEHIIIGNQVVIGSNARLETITNYKGIAEYNPYLVIEDGVTAEAGLHVGAAEYVRIGRNTMIAGKVLIEDHDHNYTDIITAPSLQPLRVDAVEIEEDCLIYENVVICKGVHIGKHCVVGANSKVVSDVPDYCVVNGNPAKIVRYYDFGVNKWINGEPKYKSPEFFTPPPVSVIIPVHNNLELTKACLKAIKTSTDQNYELIIVDNASTDGTAEFLATTNHKIITNTYNAGYAESINKGMAAASYKNIVTLNNDTVPYEGWLYSLSKISARFPEAGIIGPVSNYGAGMQTVEYNSYSEVIKRFSQSIPTQRLVGFCMYISEFAFGKLGGFDTRFGRGNFEDDDYCLRARILGFSPRIALGSFVYHKGHATFTSANINLGETMNSSWSAFKSKWGIPADANIGDSFTVTTNPNLKEVI